MPDLNDAQMAGKDLTEAIKVNGRPVADLIGQRIADACNGILTPDPDTENRFALEDQAPIEPPAEVRAVGAQTQVSTTRPARFEIIPSSELWAPVEPIDWIVDGLVAPCALTEIDAYGSSGKTWLALDMAVAVASGGVWLGHFCTRQTGVLVLDWESGRREMRRRLQMIRHGREIKQEIPGLDVACFSPPYLDEIEPFNEAIGAVANTTKLIVIDSFLASCPTLQENDSSARRPLDNLKALAEKHQLAIVILTHSKKSSGSPTKIDPREAGRGSSAIFDAADVVLHGTYREGEPLHTAQTKGRLGKKVASFDVSIEDTIDGRGVKVQWLEPGDNAPCSPVKVFDQRKQMVLDYIRHNGGVPGNEALGTRLRIGRPTVAQIVRELIDEGYVVNLGTKERPRFHTTPDRDADRLGA